MNEEHSTFILFNCFFTHSPFIAFKQKPSSLSTTVAIEILANITSRRFASQ